MGVLQSMKDYLLQDPYKDKKKIDPQDPKNVAPVTQIELDRLARYKKIMDDAAK